MLIPIGDDDRALTKPAYVTLVLIALNVLVFIFLQGFGSNASFTYGWSVIPYEITHGIDLVNAQRITVQGQVATIPQAEGPGFIYLTIFSAMFMHGGIAHLGGNMLYLWIFGDNVENRFGSGVFLLFYLVSGLIATFLQIGLDQNSVIPNLGASGAIAGILGAYLVLFPRNRVYALFIIRIISVPAFLAIGAWIILQVLGGWDLLTGAGGGGGGVAFGAHIGGFIGGVCMAAVLRFIIRHERTHSYTNISSSDGSKRYW